MMIMGRKLPFSILIILVFASTIADYHLTTAKAIVLVEGHITADTTWTPFNTYLVINNTYIDPNATLTIEPGVQVQFADNSSLIVEGSLFAFGTDAGPIVFEPSRVVEDPPEPYPGAWNTICFKGNSSEQFLLEHAKVKYAVHGVTIESLDLATIKRSEISNCSENGIMLIGESNVIIEENTIKHNKNGIATNQAEVLTGIIFNNNTISNNQENGVYLYGYSGYTGYFQWIYNVTFSHNTISSNGKNGVYLYNAGGHIYNITFFSNTISSNGKNGVFLYSYSSMYNVTFSSNIVTSNDENGIYTAAQRHHKQMFDLMMQDNIISANHQKGIWINGGINARLTNNSVSYNLFGVFYTRTSDNLAEYNDIYCNFYGMNVTLGASVNAKRNYWGQPTGPYHPSWNSEGKGNPVNGDRTDLAFNPFLTSNQGHINLRPHALLLANTITVNFNETVIFDASGSADDGQIDYYYFDFGDGTKSGWIPQPVIAHKYTEEGKYNATLIVMDELGVTSLDGNAIYVTITVVPELPSPFILQLFMITTILAVIIYIVNAHANKTCHTVKPSRSRSNEQQHTQSK